MPPLPALLLFFGVLLVAGGILVLRSFGDRYRTGRILAGTPPVTVAEAVALARAGSTGTVRVSGRIDAADEFEDDVHRPLVLRRVRLTAKGPGGWSTVDENVRAVPFAISEGLDTIAVDVEALDGGLVVVPRVSEGLAGDAPEALPGDLSPETPVRLLVEQVSSVEHATVVGRPALDRDGRPILTRTGSTPLILTTLEDGEAMRILAGGSRLRPFAAALGLGSGLLLTVAGLGLAIVKLLAG